MFSQLNLILVDFDSLYNAFCSYALGKNVKPLGNILELCFQSMYIKKIKKEGSQSKLFIYLFLRY